MHETKNIEELKKAAYALILQSNGSESVVNDIIDRATELERDRINTVWQSMSHSERRVISPAIEKGDV